MSIKKRLTRITIIGITCLAVMVFGTNAASAQSASSGTIGVTVSCGPGSNYVCASASAGGGSTFKTGSYFDFYANGVYKGRGNCSGRATCDYRAYIGEGVSNSLSCTKRVVKVNLTNTRGNSLVKTLNAC